MRLKLSSGTIFPPNTPHSPFGFENRWGSGFVNMKEIKDRIRPDWKLYSDTQWYEPTGMESLEPTINLKTHPRKPKSNQWMENLDLLRTRFKNLDYIKISTRWRTCLKNPDYKEERHKGCDLPLISSKVQSRTR